MKYSLFLVAGILFITTGQSQVNPPSVKIGNQTWMQKNLDVDHYRNGDPIPEVKDKAAWAKLTTGAWCYYNNDPAIGAIYGKLYNWYAVNDPRGLAPSGWHMASDFEWTTLTSYLGGPEIAGGKIKETGTSHWLRSNNEITNSSGFTGLPGGVRSVGFDFDNLGVFGLWWSSTDNSPAQPRVLHIHTVDAGISWVNLAEGGGSSVRCIKDLSISTEQAQVNSETVTIGIQTWMVKNLDADHYRNGDPIPEVKDPDSWLNLTTGAWCYYDNDPANGKIYGKIYNWFAVNDSRGLAPKGWHIPSEEEWLILGTNLGGYKVAGGKMKETGTTHWLNPNDGATNSSGFTGLPGGIRREHGRFYNGAYEGHWWSSTELKTSALTRLLYSNVGFIFKEYQEKFMGLSVRCLKD